MKTTEKQIILNYIKNNILMYCLTSDDEVKEMSLNNIILLLNLSKDLKIDLKIIDEFVLNCVNNKMLKDYLTLISENTNIPLIYLQIYIISGQLEYSFTDDRIKDLILSNLEMILQKLLKENIYDIMQVA